MIFDLDEQQRDFAASIDAALAAADVAGAVRAWADGDTGPGRKIWARLTDLGVTALAVPERFDGIEAHPVDLVVALERLGRWGVPGPVAESIAVAPVLLAGDERCAALASGELIVTVALPPQVPRATDADTAGSDIAGRSGWHRQRGASGRGRVRRWTPAASYSTSSRPIRGGRPMSSAPTNSERWPPPLSWSVPARRCWMLLWSTPSSAPSSAGRSGPIRRSNTNWLMCTSHSSWRGRWCTAPHCRWPTHLRHTARDVSAAKAFCLGCCVVGRTVCVADPRRDRLHRRARHVAVAVASAGAAAGLGRPGQSPATRFGGICE